MTEYFFDKRSFSAKRSLRPFRARIFRPRHIITTDDRGQKKMKSDDFRHYYEMQSKIKTKKKSKRKPKMENGSSSVGTKLSAMTLAYNLEEQKTQLT